MIRSASDRRDTTGPLACDARTGGGPVGYEETLDFVLTLDPLAWMPNHSDSRPSCGNTNTARTNCSTRSRRQSTAAYRAGKLMRFLRRKRGLTMGEDTKIKWATYSWNFLLGCDPVHTGCQNCYAQDYFKRFGIVGKRRKTSVANWKKPLKWDRDASYDKRMLAIMTAAGGPAMISDVLEVGGNRTHTAASLERLERVGYLTENPGDALGYIATGKPWTTPRVFPSLCDPFDGWQGPIVNAKGHRLLKRQEHYTVDLTMSDLRRDFFGLIYQCQNLDWPLLTKRPENIRRMMGWPPCPFCGGDPCEKNDRCASPEAVEHWKAEHAVGRSSRYRPNVWLLYSASDQETLDAGINHLLDCCGLAPVLGLSLEPLLWPIEIDPYLCPVCEGRHWDSSAKGVCANCEGQSVSWVIAGGESGGFHTYRPMDLAALHDIHEQCEAAGVPLFVKQDSGTKQGRQGRIPDDLWAVKQFPEVTR